MESGNNQQNDGLLSETIVQSVMKWNTSATDEDFHHTVSDYKARVGKRLLFILTTLFGVVVVAGIAITIGPYDIGFLEVYSTIWNHILGDIGTSTDEILKDYIVVDYRLPRVVGGIFCGAGLAICGVVMQSVLKNPLADPYTTGVSAGASFGATVAMTAKIFTMSSIWTTVALAFVMSLVPIGIMILISKMKNASPTTMIMSGIGIMYIFNAMTTVMMIWADPQDLTKIFQWQVGSIENLDWTNVVAIIAAVLVGGAIIQLVSNKLNVLATGDDNAKAMGIDANRFRILCLVLVGVLTAAIVSFTGLIGFVGLVSPHIVRLFIGADNRFLVPASAVFGGILLTSADIIGRVILPTPVQAGVIMAFMGGPLFIWLIIRNKKCVWG